MRRASLPHRLERLNGLQQSGGVERAMHELAAEHGLHPAEVRAELEVIKERVHRFGPCTTEQAVRRCAEEFRLPEAEVWAEYTRIISTSAGQR